MTRDTGDVEEMRLSERVAEAIRARDFSISDTFAMGLALIDFALRFKREVEDAHHG